MKPSLKLAFFSILFVVIALTFSAQGHAQVSRGATIRNQVTRSAQTRTCEARLSAVKRRMSQLVKLSENTFRVFSAISTRVQTFYADKVLPSGATVPNYQELIADIEAKKVAASDALASSQTNLDSFNCDGNTSELFGNFRQDMQKTKTALKEYRTAIKNLIVAVRGVAPEDMEATSNSTQ